jgi:hypothetical protein
MGSPNHSLEDAIKDIVADGWLLHSLSQFRQYDHIVWSATVRRDGPGRQLISRGHGDSAYLAVLVACDGMNRASLEPKITVHAKAKDPPITLANLLPTRPALVIRRR